MTYRPATSPPKIDPDTLPEAVHALLLTFFLDRFPVRPNALASALAHMKTNTWVSGCANRR